MLKVLHLGEAAVQKPPIRNRTVGGYSTNEASTQARNS
jgi:hypothetical protein